MKRDRPISLPKLTVSGDLNGPSSLCESLFETSLLRQKSDKNNRTGFTSISSHFLSAHGSALPVSALFGPA